MGEPPRKSQKKRKRSQTPHLDRIAASMGLEDWRDWGASLDVDEPRCEDLAMVRVRVPDPVGELRMSDGAPARTELRLVERVDDLGALVFSGGAELAPEGDLLLEDPGSDGTVVKRGRVINDANGDYVSVKVLGAKANYGRYWQLWRTEPQYRRAVSSLVQAVSSADWDWQVPKLSARRLKRYGLDVEEVTELLEERAGYLEEVFDQIEGGMRKFFVEAVISLCVPGFGVWLKLYTPEGRLRKLAYRYAHSISGFIFNELETELLAIEFEPYGGAKYIVPAHQLLIISYEALGVDPQGNTPMRTAAPWIVGKHEGMQLELLSLERFGVPVPYIKFAENTTPEEREQTYDAFDEMAAEESPVIGLNHADEVGMFAPEGQVPDYSTRHRYYDEIITTPLSGDGALVGHDQVGSYALADVKDNSTLRMALSLALIIAEALDGSSNAPTAAVGREALAQEYDEPLVGGYSPSLLVTLGERRTPAADLSSLVSATLVQPNEDVVRHMHEREGLPAPVFEDAGDQNDQGDAELEEAATRLLEEVA